MSKNEIAISDIEGLGLRKNQQAIIAFCVEADGTIRVVTWGATALKCRAASWWGQGMMNSGAMARVPFATVFGWGNGGEPAKVEGHDAAVLRLHVKAGKVPAEFCNLSESDGK